MAGKESEFDDELDPLANPGQNNKDGKNSGTKRQAVPTSFFPRTQSKMVTVVQDEQSMMGRFGWYELAGVFLPRIFRLKSDSFVSVRIAERMIFSRFFQLLPNEVVICPTIHSYRVTEVEARLLNEINTRHADCFFGKDTFTTKDLVVKEDEVDQYYQFLDMCSRKMILKKSSEKDKCGFLRIGGTSDVPYTEVEGIKYMPVFYFEGAIDQSMCLTLRGWDWAYLRFCCKVQGVKDDLIASNCCESVALHDLREYFPLETTFVEYWPAKDYISRVVSKMTTQPGSWTRVITNPEGKKFQGKLTLIKEFPLQLTGLTPYKAQKALIENKPVKCLNIRPYQFMEVMVTLPHMVDHLFPSFTEEQVGDMMVSLGVVMYKGNKGQLEVIKQERWEDTYEQVPLVTVRDILANMQNLKNAVKAGDLGGKRAKGT
eukprot:GFUD01039422.1.p1 GENE.GFUD01039422.1~~GFUD01039422.1.p1  ORF type:complete len:448 (+),score=122.52 GFUD01039422.1:58-1344(+)